MSTIIEVDQNQINSSDKLNLHFLPAKIIGDGEANVDEYFNKYTTTENGVLYNALRGYPLNGTVLNVPEDYTAMVLQEPPNLEGLDTDRKLHITGTFKEFTYWNYDKIPSKADAYVQSLEWTKLAKQLSTPITEEEVLNEMEAHKKEIESKENA